jgi:hypothetical protein
VVRPTILSPGEAWRRFDEAAFRWKPLAQQPPAFSALAKLQPSVEQMGLKRREKNRKMRVTGE